MLNTKKIQDPQELLLIRQINLHRRKVNHSGKTNPGQNLSFKKEVTHFKFSRISTKNSRLFIKSTPYLTNYNHLEHHIVPATNVLQRLQIGKDRR